MIVTVVLTIKANILTNGVYILSGQISMNDRDSVSDRQGKYPENCASCFNNQEKNLNNSG
jgi:hypothetical protein